MNIFKVKSEVEKQLYEINRNNTNYGICLQEWHNGSAYDHYGGLVFEIIPKGLPSYIPFEELSIEVIVNLDNIDNEAQHSENTDLIVSLIFDNINQIIYDKTNIYLFND